MNRPSLLLRSSGSFAVISSIICAASLACGTAAFGGTLSPERAGFAVSHIPSKLSAFAANRPTAVSQPIMLDLVLEPRNKAGMDTLLAHLSDPRDPEYGAYLTPDQFRDQFGATDAQVRQVEDFAMRHGFQVDHVSPSNLIVQVKGTVGDADEAFGITLRDYTDSTGRIFHAPSSEPTAERGVAALIHGILGLSNMALAHTFSHIVPAPAAGVKPSYNGVDGLSPYDTSSIYQMDSSLSAGVDGSGQVLGLAELGTYSQSDVNVWDNEYSYPKVPITAISVDGFNTGSAPNSGTVGEFELDIYMLETWAFGASGIRCYEASPNVTSAASFITEMTDIFDKMATDSTRANVISVSYGLSENEMSKAEITSEGEVLQQLALQGQTVCVASGDAGAWTDQSGYPSENPNTSDPGSQPFITSVGGTDLATYTLSGSSNLHMLAQSSWYDPSDTGRGKFGTGGGGGVSQWWGIPSYQVGSFFTNINVQGSTTNRNVPDVSLYGDYDDGTTGGYSVYVKAGGGPGWAGENGTSAASPLWAGFLADVNQVRKANGLPNLGLANPDIYLLAESANYSFDFYDVDNGSDNGFYFAFSGYDNSTGWGTLQWGSQALSDLALAPVFVNYGMKLNKASVTGGGSDTGTLSISLPAVQAETITLSSNSASAKVPASVTIAAGKTSKTFTVTTKAVTVQTVATITATFHGYSEQVSLTINP